MNTRTYDVAIIGGGCAGLALCYYLSQLNLNLSIVVIDQRQDYQDDRTWTFWQDQSTENPHADIISKRWQRWHFSHTEKIVEHHATQYEYCLIRSIDYYRKMLDIIRNDKRFDLFLNHQYESCSYDNIEKKHVILTNQSTIHANILINTLSNNNQLKDAKLHQIFYGCEITTEEPLFDSASIGLMTNMKSYADDFEFTYVIPYSENHALIEVTQFSKSYKNPTTLQEKCLAEVTKVTTKVLINRTEMGILPMGLKYKIPTHQSNQYYDLSQTSGTLRSSSGYGFNRIQQKAQILVKDLFDSEINTRDKQKISRIGLIITSALDHIFLKVLSKHIELAPLLFMRMGALLNADDFAGFMSEEYTLNRVYNIITAMPKRVFLQEAMTWR